MTSNFSEDCFGFDNGTAKTIGIVRTAASSLSLLVSTAILVVLCVQQTWKKGHGQRLFLCFTITVVFEAPSCIMQSAIINYDNLTVDRPLCIAAGIYNQYSNWLINLVILWIAFYLFRVYIMNVFRTSAGKKGKKVKSRIIGVIILVLILVVPIPFSLIPLVGQKYGIVDAMCWIVNLNKQKNCLEKDKLGIFYQYSCWFVPFILEVIVLSLLSVVIFFTFLRGYNKYRGVPIVQKEFYYRIQEFLPLLVSISVYNIFCIFRVANFTIDSVTQDPRPIMWIVNIITSHLKEVIVMIGYLSTLQIIFYRARKKSKTIGLVDHFKDKEYSTFEVITPRAEENESMLLENELST